MTASRRSESSTGDPSGTLSTSMPSSAGASTERVTCRWDPGRRPSSRVSSTSGALGSRLVTDPLRRRHNRTSGVYRCRRRVRNRRVDRPLARPSSAIALEVLGQPDRVDVVAAELVEYGAPRQPGAAAADGLEGAFEGELEVRQGGVDVVVGLLAQLAGLGLGADDQGLALALGDGVDLGVGDEPVALEVGVLDDLVG